MGDQRGHMIARFVQAALLGGAIGLALWLLVGVGREYLERRDVVDDYLEQMRRHGGA